MYAVIETGGKQYKVSADDVITVEKLDADEGAKITLDKVLLIGEGANVKAGAPYVAGASVTASVLGRGKAKKVIVYKYKPKKGFHKKKGHRQPFTTLKIETVKG
jgi:large subunit ribosomal protein L21